LARALELPFQDLDPLVLARLGRESVVEAFERDGEPAWRQAESETLREVLRHGAGVVALGGGTPTAPGAAVALRQAQASHRARIALLHPGETELLRRLTLGRGDRPRLAGNDAAEVARSCAQRLPLYRSMADAVIDTRLPESECIRRLRALLTNRP
jgi:shikimate kinase